MRCRSVQIREPQTLMTIAYHLQRNDRLFPDGVEGQERKRRIAKRLQESPVIGVIREKADGNEKLGMVLWLTECEPDVSAKVHLASLEGELLSYSECVDSVLDQIAVDYPALWCEVPEHSWGVARWAEQRLGFGGEYPLLAGPNAVRMQVAGVRRHAVPWNGKWWDALILERTRRLR